MSSPKRILHILSQQPSHTGSGISLDAIIRLAKQAGYEQHAVVGVPAGASEVTVGNLAPRFVHPVFFQAEPGSASNPTTAGCDLDYPIPGMSDVMPYRSTVWSRMTVQQLQEYRDVWRRHLSRILAQFQPHLIHSNHLWLVSSLLKDLCGPIPVIATCHATGLRQLALCPHLATEVKSGCSRLDHICVLRHDHQRELSQTLGIAPAHVTVTGIGFRDEVFHRGLLAPQESRQSHNILYIGKFSRAKGLPWLLDAVASLRERHPQLHLHIAGDGAGTEAEKLRERMAGLGAQVTMHGMLDQEALAQLMGRCAVAVLPSFYEGVPLVLAEAAACGCQIVATELPGVTEQLAAHLGPSLHLVPMPRLLSVDEPAPEDLPSFVENLAAALATALQEKDLSACDLTPLTWRAVFSRIEKIWIQHLGLLKQ